MLPRPLTKMPAVAQAWLCRLRRDVSGNTTALVAAGMAPLLAMIGGGIDMARSYLSEARLQQACDAGVLAARKTLGSEAVVTGDIPDNVAAAGERFFDVNFRSGAYGTVDRTFEMTLEDDYSISGVATVEVPTTIMRIFGFTEVPVQVECTAKLNFSNTDVMMVLDTTASMLETNPGDSQTRMAVLKQVVRNFHAQLEASKGPGIRVRYGFVPYATNVNVGALLENDWVVDQWTYQSREFSHTSNALGTRSYTENFVHISGSFARAVHSTYAATYNPPSTEYGVGSYSCNTPAPASTYAASYTLLSTTTSEYAGPPPGTMVRKRYRRVGNGTYYWISRSGTTCTIYRDDYSAYTDEYDEVTVPTEQSTTHYRYAPIARDVGNWRSETNGCIEERSTYQIDDYDNVDFARALDLDLDSEPSAGNPDTQWRPRYPNIIYERRLNSGGAGTFHVPAFVSASTFFRPATLPGLIACPAPARKLAEMDAATLNTYLGSINAAGTTYHDIGMIWGGRLISPTGLFAEENADVTGKPTSRHLIFLTDGVTEAFDIAYGAYGVEPLDRRRWQGGSALSLNQVVEKRFGVACNEVKKRNVTVWVIGFGVAMTDMLKQCAGDGHWFQAESADELNDVFSTIAASMGDLRISR
jgi:hypothetical protein